MLTTSQADLPLSPAMKSEIEGVGGPADRHAVLESEIWLEIENRFGKRIAVHRTVKGTRNQDLITVHDGPALTSDKPFSTSDFFVGRSGAASREAGFHHFLASFMSLKPPVVQTFDGREYPLYLQCVFPFFFVEQTRGWGSVQPPVPTQFRIRDVHKRAIEFILDLDAHRVALRRQELQHEQENLRAAWGATFEKAQAEAANINGVVHSLPSTPVAKWPPEVAPAILVPVGQQWLPAQQVIDEMTEEWKELVNREIPRVEEIASAAEEELSTAERRLKEREVLYSRLLDSLEMEREEVSATENRLRIIDEDIQRNKDTRVLQQLGSTAMPNVTQGICPTCQQSIQDSLLPLAEKQTIMSLDENIQFLSEQRRTFEGMLTNSRRIMELRERRMGAIREEINQLHDRIRALRQTLVADGRLPSIAAIENRMRLEESIRRISKALERIQEILEEFDNLAFLWLKVQEELGRLPSDDTTEDDKAKIGQWSAKLTEQLGAYGFRSLPANSIDISRDTYRPEHEGFDVTIDATRNASVISSVDVTNSISASDLIRMIWAYLHGMLELSRETKTNHPGLMVFDEPRQQSMKEVSFRELLRRASMADRNRQQVVLFTSENLDNLCSYLADLPHTLTECEGRMIRKL
jgi:hypothetical protein